MMNSLDIAKQAIASYDERAAESAQAYALISIAESLAKIAETISITTTTV